MAITPNTIAITATGLVTSLGLDCETSIASARAGLLRPRELDYLVHNDALNTDDPAIGYPLLGGLADGFEGVARLMRIAQLAFEDFKVNVDLKQLAVPKCGWIVVLPDPKYWSANDSDAEEPVADERVSWNVDAFRAALFNALEVRVHEGNMSIIASGHAGVAQALQQARDHINEGRWDRCVIAALDSLVEPTALNRIDKQHRLKSDDNPVGLRPGEAGGFMLIERATDATTRGARIHAIISDVSTGFDGDHFDSKNPGVGRGIAETVVGLRALQTLQQPPVMVVDLNGEVFRSRDWGCALQRMSMSQPQLRDAEATFPAAAFGDTGAVSALIGICASITGMQRDYWRSEHALILSSSDAGARGGILASKYSIEAT